MSPAVLERVLVFFFLAVALAQDLKDAALDEVVVVRRSKLPLASVEHELDLGLVGALADLLDDAVEDEVEALSELVLEVLASPGHVVGVVAENVCVVSQAAAEPVQVLSSNFGRVFHVRQSGN